MSKTKLLYNSSLGGGSSVTTPTGPPSAGALDSVAAAHRSLEDAKQQFEKNEVLRRAVLDGDRIVRRIHGSQNTAAHRKHESLAQVARVAQHLDMYEKNTSFDATRAYNPERFLLETGQRVPLAELSSCSSSDNSNDSNMSGRKKKLEHLQQMHRSLSTFKQTVDRMSKYRPAQRPKTKKEEADEEPPQPVDLPQKGPLMLFLGQAITQIEDVMKVCESTEGLLDVERWAGLTDPLMVLLEEVIGIPAAGSIIDEEQETLHRMAFQAEELRHQQEQAVEAGDMKSTETLYFQQIAVEEAMVQHFNKMYERLGDATQMHYDAPLVRVKDVNSRANDDISQLMKRSEDFKGRVTSDRQKLLQLMSQASEAEVAGKQQFNALKSQSDAWLRENQDRTERCYAALVDIEKMIESLAKERTDALERRLQLVQQEAQRCVELTHFRHFADEHCKRLDTTLSAISAADGVTDVMDELLCNGCNAVHQCLQGVEGALNETTQEVHKMRLGHFRQLYLTLGDLQYKKERYLEELAKKIEMAHVQQEIAMDTFNPKAKELAEAKKALQRVQTDMESQVQLLTQKSQLHIEAFKPTEQALIESGTPFVNPVDELAQRNTQRQQKLLEYHKLMADGEEAGGEGGGQGAAAAKGNNTEEGGMMMGMDPASLGMMSSGRGGGGGGGQGMGGRSASSSSATSSSLGTSPRAKQSKLEQLEAQMEDERQRVEIEKNAMEQRMRSRGGSRPTASS